VGGRHSLGSGGSEQVTEKLTPAQARWIEERAYQLREAGTHFVLAAFQDALDELTADPGDREFCQGCEYWGRGYASPTDKIPVWDCEHWNARDGYCPTDHWGEKGEDFSDHDPGPTYPGHELSPEQFDMLNGDDKLERR